MNAKKALAALILSLGLLLGMTACGGAPESGAEPSAPVVQEDAPAEPDAGNEAPGVLVAYFSATGNTEGVARTVADLTGGDLYEIVPAQPYTDADLDYTTPDSRSQQERADPDARPEIRGSVEQMDDYAVVFLGYPIWNGQAPKIVSTFLESYDFDGVTIVPFCTSGSSPIGSSAESLEPLAPNGRWLAGQRFPAGAPEADIQAWLDGLDL